jgi:L-cysteine/cystine lyase
MNLSIEAHRQQFPYLDRYTYFNYGGQGVMFRGAMDAIQQAQETMQAIAPFSLASNDWIMAETAKLRLLIASELGAPIESITITEDTTVGCNIALWGIDWQAGDRILMTDCEHQGVIAIVNELKHRFGIEIDIVPIMETVNNGDPVQVIQAAIKPKTRMVVLSHILWNTGQVLPLMAIAAICRSAGVMTLVDAAQSVGMLPLNLVELGINFYAFTGHKWWCGPAGIGGLYVRPEMHEALRPTFIGWRSVITDRQGQPTRFKANGERYEVATAAVPLYPGLVSAIVQHQSFGAAAVRYALICDRSRQLWEGLGQLSQVRRIAASAPASGLVSFQLENGKHYELVQALENQQIFVRLLFNPNCVRACVHYFSTEAEIERLIKAVGECG